MNKYRQWAILSILIIGLLATVATSPPPDYIIGEQAEMNFVGPTTVRAFVRVDARSAAHADEFRVAMVIDSITGPWTVVAVPDDPNFEPISIEAGPIEQEILFPDAIIACVDDGDCEFGVSFDIPENQEIRIQVDSSLLAYGDPSFFFPEDRSFPDDATMTIGFDDASVGQ